jgi:putative membrane protein
MKTLRPSRLGLYLGCLSAPWLASAQTMDATPYRWHGHMMGDGWGIWWGGPLMLMLLVAIGALVFLLGRRSSTRWHDRHPGGSHMHGGSAGQARDDSTFSAMQILNERLARGEIDRQDYEEKKAAILSPGR